MHVPAARVVASLGVAQTIAWGSTYYLPAILARHMAADIGSGTAYVYAAFSGALLLSAFLAPASGRIIDLYGGRRVLALSNLLFAAGLAILAAASGRVSLLAGWLVLGIGMSAGLYESAFSTLAGIYGGAARRPITGITLIAGFASTICWPLSAWMDSGIGWRAACLVWAAVQLAVALPLNLSLPRSISGARAPAPLSPAAPAGNRRPLMAALAFVFAATWFCSTAMAAHLPRLLQQAGASLELAIAAAALVGPAQVAARVLEFWLMRRASPVLSARLASLAHPLGAATLIAFGAPLAPVFAMAHGAGNGVMTIANGTLPLHYFGAGGYGLRQGLLMVPARLLQATAPFAFAVLLSRYGVAALTFTAALGLCSFAVLMRLPRGAPRAAASAAEQI